MTFATWQAAQFTAGELANDAISGPNGDPDGDSQTNLLEFAAGTLPKDVHSVSSLLIGEDAGHITISITKGSGLTGFTDVLEWGADLQAFSDAHADFSVHAQEDLGAGVTRVTTAAMTLARPSATPNASSVAASTCRKQQFLS